MPDALPDGQNDSPNQAQAAPISFEDFRKVDIRLGRILSAEPLAKARKPAYRLSIDFGPLGIRHSSAQITALYPAEALPGRLVLAVVNFPPKRIAGFVSEVLVLGLDDEGGRVALLGVDRDLPLGRRVY